MQPGTRTHRRDLLLAAVLLLGIAGVIYAGEQEYAKARAAMVAELRRPAARHRITDGRVLAVMGKVPRHRFVPESYRARAYAEIEVPIGHGEVMSKPYLVALMMQTLSPGRKARVLEVGTGVGYQTAVLAELCSSVHSIERHKAHHEAAAVHLYALGYRNVKLAIGEESRGWPAEGPYDAILITAPVERVPSGLVSQLSNGGCLVYALGTGPERTLNRLRRRGDLLRAEAVIPVSMSATVSPARRR